MVDAPTYHLGLRSGRQRGDPCRGPNVFLLTGSGSLAPHRADGETASLRCFRDCCSARLRLERVQSEGGPIGRNRPEGVFHEPRHDPRRASRRRDGAAVLVTTAVAEAAPADVTLTASVIVTPSSIVRMIVSATIGAGRQVGSDTGLPGVDDDSVQEPSSSATWGPSYVNDTDGTEHLTSPSSALHFRKSLKTTVAHSVTERR